MPRPPRKSARKPSRKERRARLSARKARAPQDGSYKHLFSHPEMVEGLLRDFVHEDWLTLIDFSTLEKQGGSYVTDDLREREDDIIWRVRVAGDWLYVYLLIEFQSQVDPWMAVRVMVYTGLLYQDLIKSGAVAAGQQLPPVFPLVLYNGSGRWTAARDIAELIVPLPNALARYRPQHRYHLIDEGRIGPDTLAQATSVAAELVRLETLAAEGPAALRPILSRLSARLRGPGSASLRRALTVWFARVLLRRLLPGENLPQLHDIGEVETMLAEHVDEWTRKWMREGERIGKLEGERLGKLEGERKGKLEGKREGKLEGERVGKLEGKRDALKRLLRVRFGDLPPWAQARIDAAALGQLDIWLDGLFQAATLDVLLGGQPPESDSPEG